MVLEQAVEMGESKCRKTPVAVSSRDSGLYETVRQLREEMAEIRKRITDSRAPSR